MTSLTTLPEGEQPEIIVNPTATVSAIDPMIYGGFTEHMGRCVYGGLYDPTNAHGLVDEHGFRTDVIAAMRDELKVPVVRWPGGNFVATYHWLDGVGPKDKRPKRAELAWQTIEDNQFGTDEFMLWCEKVGTEPYLALNFGTGTLDEALAWVEYCNSDKDTYYAQLRRANGREKPYNVKYWALGNEVWGPWQVEQTTKEAYAQKANQWAKALKLLDPSIVLILCGQDGHRDDWDRYVLQECISITDMHSIHLYTTDLEHLPNVTAPLAAERAIQMTASLIELAHIRSGSATAAPARPRPTICFDEWNVYDDARYPGVQGAEMVFDVSDTLAVAVWLNVFVRQSAHLGMCNIAQNVNVIAPLLTLPDGLVRQPIYWPLLLFVRFMQGETLAVHLRCPTWNGARTSPPWLRSCAATPWLDVAAARDRDGYVSLSVVNISDTHDWATALSGVAGSGSGSSSGPTAVAVYTVGAGDSANLRNQSMDPASVSIKESSWDGQGLFTFPKHSHTILRWKA